MKLSDAIAPAFFGLHEEIRNNTYTHYVLKGGRGSAKSSFISIELILGLMRHPDTHAVALRSVGNTLQDSVFSQLLWAAEVLEVARFFKATKSPLKMVYLPTGQTILFRGADDPQKIKSIRPSFGYFRYIWFEEWNQFGGMEETRSINQSLMRGGEVFDAFYSYNPPERMNDWVNLETQEQRPGRVIHHSTYETVPPGWLGRQFLLEARHLKTVHPQKYAHEYLGTVTGTGGEVFRNVTLREMTDREIGTFDRIRRGLDWGYAVDPFVYLVLHYDRMRRRLYIFYEIYQVGLSNRLAAERIKSENALNREVVADSAEPKSIAELNAYGIRAVGARKGPDSVKHGIQWLSDLEEIVIDQRRCPNAAREFRTYELERDAAGNFKARYPDRNNHAIDAARYAVQDDMTYAVVR
ncbi:MAG: PBSX family phage terminase large subunit [Oscillospiraceae bacterium]|nr:PBSX family phage terminase large subunit [Oscillospiraceae bacterium]